MCVHVCASVHVYVCAHVHARACVRACACVYMCVHISVYYPQAGPRRLPDAGPALLERTVSDFEFERFPAVTSIAVSHLNLHCTVHNYYSVLFTKEYIIY